MFPFGCTQLLARTAQTCVPPGNLGRRGRRILKVADGVRWRITRWLSVRGTAGELYFTAVLQMLATLIPNTLPPKTCVHFKRCLKLFHASPKEGHISLRSSSGSSGTSTSSIRGRVVTVVQSHFDHSLSGCSRRSREINGIGVLTHG